MITSYDDIILNTKYEFIENDESNGSIETDEPKL